MRKFFKNSRKIILAESRQICNLSQRQILRHGRFQLLGVVVQVILIMPALIFGKPNIRGM